MGSFRSLPVLVLLLTWANLLPMFGFARKLPPRHQHWLNEHVVYIIAPKERKTFLALESDSQREEFIHNFWRIRDPDLSTEVNEYQIEHEKRIAYANEHFHSGIPGWKTERGRIYIMHGPPDSIAFSMGGEKLLVRVRNPTEVLTEGLADRRNFFPVELDSPQAEIWVYTHLPTATSTRGYFEIIFGRADSQRLYLLKDTMTRLGDGRGTYQERLARDTAIKQFQQSQSASRQLEILYAGEYRFQGIDDFMQSIFSNGLSPSFNRAEVQSALRDLARTSGEVLHETLERERRLKELVASRVFFQEFSLSVSERFLRSSSAGTLVAITFGIDRRFAGETIEILIELVRPDGTRAGLVADSMPIDPATPARDIREFLYQTRLSVRPGPHLLRVYGYLNGRKSIAIHEKELVVPDFSGQELMVSDILLFDEVLSRSGDAGEGVQPKYASRFLGGSAPLFLRDHVLIPAPDEQFRRSQELTLLFEVYNPGIGREREGPSLSLSCVLWQGNQRIASIAEKQLNYFTQSGSGESDRRKTTYGLSVPLRSLHPGDYRIELVVEDPLLQRSVSTGTAFQVY